MAARKAPARKTRKVKGHHRGGVRVRAYCRRPPNSRRDRYGRSDMPF